MLIRQAWLSPESGVSFLLDHESLFKTNKGNQASLLLLLPLEKAFCIVYTQLLSEHCPNSEALHILYTYLLMQHHSMEKQEVTRL